jgi:hypothetical protein
LYRTQIEIFSDSAQRSDSFERRVEARPTIGTFFQLVHHY